MGIFRRLLGRGRSFATSSAVDSKTPNAFRPGLEEMEARVVPSSLPLHVASNVLKDSANNTVVLRGVNVPSLAWRTDGDNVLESVDIAINNWHANLIRLPVNEDFWFGYDQAWPYDAPDPGGAAYRALIDQVISKTQADNAYVMLDVHWSDMGVWGANNGQHFMPDDHTTQFWQSAAARYANNPAVLFDPYNEPTVGLDRPSDADFATWQNGGWITETDLNSGQVIGTYHSPGMQGLINTIRASGANNVVAPEGLDWGSDLTGVLTGHALSDPTGNLMYQSHLYPDKLANPTIANSVAAVASSHPIYVGEWGDGGVIGQPSNSAASSNQNMLAYLDLHNYSWTAWALFPDFTGGPYNLLTSWNASSPTSDYGVFVQANLAAHANHANQPPTVATAAHASASTVTGKTTNLTVLGADDGGEANLTYTWTTINAPAAVTFSSNGSNAAKNTTTTFSQAGTYTFQVTIRDSGGLTANSSVQVTVKQTLSSVAVSPAQPSLTVGSRQQFTASARDQFGKPLATQPAFTWSLTGGGTISTSGLYVAPAATGSATVKATTGAVSGSTTVRIVPKVSATAAFADTDDWGSGFTGYVSLHNTGTTAINGWTLAFDFTGNLTDVWDCQVISHVGNYWVVQNVSWDATIAAGQSISFGFNADWGTPRSAPTNFVLNGVPIVGVPTVSATAAFADTDDWGSGFTGYVTLHNTGTTAINGWTLAFDFTGNLTDVWDCQVISHVGNYWVVQNVSWDATIAAGQSVSFGFNADWGTARSAPTNFVLNGVAIKGL